MFRAQVRHSDPKMRTDVYFRVIKIVQELEKKYSHHPKKLDMLKYVNSLILSQIELVENTVQLP